MGNDKVEAALAIAMQSKIEPADGGAVGSYIVVRDTVIWTEGGDEDNELHTEDVTNVLLDYIIETAAE